MLSREEKYAALQEAQHVLRLEKTWHQLVPNEPKPNFKKAAEIILRRALGHQTVPKEPRVNITNDRMHLHDRREAELIERTLRNGIIPEDVLHSFRHGRAPVRRQNMHISRVVGSRQPLPAKERKPILATHTDIEAVHTTLYTDELEFPTHLNVRTGEYIPKHDDHPRHLLIHTRHEIDQPTTDLVELPEPAQGAPVVRGVLA
jgi:hypothetical protein